GKIAQFCNVDFGCVVESPDVKSIYEIPLKLHEQGLDREVCMRLHLETKEPDLRAWAQMVEKILNPADRARIAVVGKYTQLADSYKSIHEALGHGGIANECGVQIDWISSDRFIDQAAAGELLGDYGMRCSGLSPDGSPVEMIELPDHPWFIGCQFHPELKSRPTRPHPLFAGFVGAARQQRRARGTPSLAQAERSSQLAGRRDCHGAAPRARS